MIAYNPFGLFSPSFNRLPNLNLNRRTSYGSPIVSTIRSARDLLNVNRWRLFVLGFTIPQILSEVLHLPSNEQKLPINFLLGLGGRVCDLFLSRIERLQKYQQPYFSCSPFVDKF